MPLGPVHRHLPWVLSGPEPDRVQNLFGTCAPPLALLLGQYDDQSPPSEVNGQGRSSACSAAVTTIKTRISSLTYFWTGSERLFESAHEDLVLTTAKRVPGPGPVLAKNLVFRVEKRKIDTFRVQISAQKIQPAPRGYLAAPARALPRTDPRTRGFAHVCDFFRFVLFARSRTCEPATSLASACRRFTRSRVGPCVQRPRDGYKNPHAMLVVVPLRTRRVCLRLQSASAHG